MNNGQKDLFENSSHFSASIKLKSAGETPLSEKLNWEKELLGLYVSAHPLESYKSVLVKKTLALGKINESIVGRRVKIGGIVSSVKKIITRTGKPMLFLSVEDLTDKIEVVVFPSAIERNPAAFQENKIVFIKGRVDNRDNVPKIICEEIEEIINEN